MVNFRIGNMRVNTVNGTFTGMRGTLQFDPLNLSGSVFSVCIDPATVNTGINRRDRPSHPFAQSPRRPLAKSSPCPAITSMIGDSRCQMTWMGWHDGVCSGGLGRTGPAPSKKTTGSNDRTWPVTTGPVTTGPVTTGPVTTGPDITGPVTTGPDITGPVTTGPVTTGPVTTGPDITGPDITGPDITSIAGGERMAGHVRPLRV